MQILYQLALSGYGFLIRTAARFNPKAKLWIEGRKGWRETVEQKMASITGKRIWMHCASLGEFEQGRPLLEHFRAEYPEFKIILTFFSPSGFENRKTTPLADAVFYLPLDGPIRSKKFVELLKPDMVFFVKYEFWYFFGKYLHDMKVPYFCISANFRPSQIFFKPYGNFFRKMLLRFTHMFVQNQASLALLYKHRVTNVTVAGDTRLDRVWANKQNAMHDGLIEAFATDHKVIVAGSTWSDDEKLLLKVMAELKDFKLIIAPHELSSSHLQELKTLFINGVFYSNTTKEAASNAQVLIIDNIGMLSKLYRAGRYAYIGGGFGAGIHNTLEAAVYGVPVFIGPDFEKFTEARELVRMKGAFSINSAQQMTEEIQQMEKEPSRYDKSAEVCRSYVESRKGATGIIMNYLRLNSYID